MKNIGKYLIFLSYVASSALFLVELLYAVLSPFFSENGFGLTIALFCLLGLSGADILILSAIYFVGGPERVVSKGRIKAALFFRTVDRLAHLAYAVVLLILSFRIPNAEGVKHLFFVSSLIIMVLQLIVLLFSFWHRAWVKENPERYQTMVVPHPKKDITPKEDAPEISVNKKQLENKRKKLTNHSSKK